MALYYSLWDGRLIDDSLPRFLLVDGQVQDRYNGNFYDEVLFVERATLIGLPDGEASSDITDWPPVIPPVSIPIIGPFTAFGVTYYINTRDCLAGFNIDDDDMPDIWLTAQQVADSDMHGGVKRSVLARMAANGCTVPQLAAEKETEDA